MERLRMRYLVLLGFLMRRRMATVALATALIATAVGSLAYIGTEFMPRLDEGSILVETRKLPGIALSDSVRISTRIENIIKSFQPVNSVVTKIGRPDLATEAMGRQPGRRLRAAQTARAMERLRRQRAVDHGDVGGAGEGSGRQFQLHPADGDAARRSGVGHQSGRGGENLRRGSASARREGRAGAARVEQRRRRGRRPDGDHLRRGRIGRDPGSAADRPLRAEHVGHPRGGADSHGRPRRVGPGGGAASLRHCRPAAGRVPPRSTGPARRADRRAGRRAGAARTGGASGRDARAGGGVTRRRTAAHRGAVQCPRSRPRRLCRRGPAPDDGGQAAVGGTPSIGAASSKTSSAPRGGS